jgi:hypothetical protein
LPDDGPLRPLADVARYFTNNRDRTDYARYRREGLPITSSPMESLIKQINKRVQGTEMFWLQPAGAEAILQTRAASLSEDGRLEGVPAKPHRPSVHPPFASRLGILSRHAPQVRKLASQRTGGLATSRK